MKRMLIALTALLAPTCSYSYEVILTEIINNTPHPITFVGRNVAFPMPVPTVPAQPVERIKKESPLLDYPIIIPGNGRTQINKMVINNEESHSGAEIFFTFTDNKKSVFALTQGNRMVTFAPLLGWKREGVTFQKADGTYAVSFTFDGTDGITRMEIKKSSR